MALTPGTRLGVYEITAPLGEGGMGQVWRATDTTLGRQVAIKILPDSFAADPDRLARFEREAKTLALLNHPHIAAIYAVEKSGGALALVMELVEGDDLSQRIGRGAIPIDEALPIAKQIAEALEAAHEQGIIHRDLKPANIKVRADGTVKVLDFGLAKAMDPPAGSSPNVSQSPTITTPAMTQAGMILGTAAYMAPEQARGKPVDKRADIWAFGAVLFEMLTGKRAFPGEDLTDTLAAVVRAEPNWTLLPAGLPSALVVYIKRCLQKDPKQRIPDIAAMRLALDGAFETAAQQTPPPILAAPQPVWRRALPVVAAMAAGALLTVATISSLWPRAAPLVNRFSYRVPDLVSSNARQAIAVSPDGRRFAYAATGGLQLRGLDELEAHVIPGSEAASASNTLFFSPDGQSVAYWQWQTGQLKRLAISGGAAVVIGSAENPTGAFWGPDGTILFGQPAGILRVPASGGPSAVVVAAQAGELLGPSQLLPDGDTMLVSVLGRVGVRVEAQKISTGERRVLVEGGFAPRYLATGHLVYLVGNTLMGVAFDPRRLEVTGGAVPVARDVAYTPIGLNSRAFYGYDVAADGTLVHVYSPAVADSWQVALSDRAGAVTPLALPAGPNDMIRVSPDGTRVAVGVSDPKEAYIAIWDLDGRTALRRLTFGGNNRYPAWSRDGQRVTYQSDREGDRALFWQPADGNGPAERLTTPDKDTTHVPASWAPNDETLLYAVVPSDNPAGPGSLWSYERSRGTAAPFGGVTAAMQSPMFSPDGRWVVYAGLERGTLGIYVQPFPTSGAKFQLPKPTASPALTLPVWSPDGTALFYVSRAGQLAVAAVTTRPTFAFGNPAEVPRRFRGTVDGTAYAPRTFDVLPDGRFIGLHEQGQAGAAAGAVSTQPEVHIVLNWFEEVKRLVPVK